MCFSRGLNTKQAGPRVLIFGLTKSGDIELWTFRENQKAENSLFLFVSYPTRIQAIFSAVVFHCVSSNGTFTLDLASRAGGWFTSY